MPYACKGGVCATCKCKSAAWQSGDGNQLQSGTG
ncbi:hypothetical protein K3392_12250 [Escherichia coli]|nr:hypothetical protein K3392_12250 [Escherichia coli]